jgi:polygalacturonase
VPFYFLANSQLTVTLLAADGTQTTKVLNTDYTVTGAGVATGGTVTMLSAPASSTTLTISRNVPLTQETDFLPNDRLPAESLEQTVDKLTMITQQLDETLDRTIKFPVSDSSSLSATLPIAATRATKYLKFDTSGQPTVGTVDAPSVTVEDFGAVGDGSTDDTAAIQAAINAMVSGSTLLFDRTYKIVSSLTITSKSRIRLTGKGKVFLFGAASSAYIFKLVGTCDEIEIDGLTLEGDNNSSYTQTAIGCDSGQTISNTRFHDLNISKINVGIAHNANLSGSWTKGFTYSNTFKDILGTVSGSGYGILMAKATQITATENVFDNCGRHSIYQGAGTNCNNLIANNIIVNHRSTVADGSFRAAAVIARSSDVTFTGNKFYNCKDCCLEISHVTSDSANCTNILVEGNSFTNRGNAVHTILIGEQAIPGSYSTSHVNIFNNTFDDDLAVTASLPPNIYILNGTNITIESNRFVRRNVSGSLSACVLFGDNTYLSSSAQLNNLTVRNNVATADATAGTAGFVTVCSTAATGTNYYWIKDNYAQNWPKLIEWDATPTNPNSFLRFRVSTNYNFSTISANTGTAATIQIDGCKRTSSVRGRPQYSLISSNTMYSFYAKDDADNFVAIQVVNVSGSPIDPVDQTFILDIEDVEPYYG